MLLLIVPVCILIMMPGCASLWTVRKVQAVTGGSITIPCYYNWRFQENEKFWCRGTAWYICTRVLESKGRASVTDNRAELVTTLTLNGLQIQDSGRYWCAVKIKGLMKNDLRASLELQVQNVPDLWVRTPALCVPEGGTISVQCLYSNNMKKAEKSWCRGGAMQSCQSERVIRSSEQSSLQLKDDGRGLFTVTIARLQRGDAGWYWCSTAGVQAPIHINVTTSLHNTTHNYTVFPELISSSSPSPSSSSHTSTAALTHTHSTNRTQSSTVRPSSSFGPSTAKTSTQSASSTADTHLTQFTRSELNDSPAAAPTTSLRLRALSISIVITLIVLIMATVCWRRRVHHQHREVQVNDGWAESLELTMSEEEDGEQSDEGETLDGDWTDAAVLQLHTEENA